MCIRDSISKVCRNVETEPLLQPLDNEVFNLQSTVMSREARLDMKAGGFWTPGVTAFFDVRVTHVNSRSNQGKHTATIFKEQENEKKRKYNQRVMNVEMQCRSKGNISGGARESWRCEALGARGVEWHALLENFEM